MSGFLIDLAPRVSKLITYQQSKTTSAGAVSATTTKQMFRAVRSGTLKSVFVSTPTAITANDTDYWAFTVVNKGNAGSGTTDMILATDVNTTKATGGSGITASVPKSLTVHTTPANLNFSAGDLIVITMTKAASATTMADVIVDFNFQDS